MLCDPKGSGVRGYGPCLLPGMPLGIANTGIGLGPAYGPFIYDGPVHSHPSHSHPPAHRPRCCDPCHERFHHDPRKFAIARLVRSLEHQATVNGTSNDGDAYERAGVDPTPSKPTREAYVTWPRLPGDFAKELVVPQVPGDHDSPVALRGYNELTGMPTRGGLIDVLI